MMVGFKKTRFFNVPTHWRWPQIFCGHSSCLCGYGGEGGGKLIAFAFSFSGKKGNAIEVDREGKSEQ